MKWVARYRINREIRHHQILKDVYSYAEEHGICIESFHHSVYTEEMKVKAEYETRYINRLTKLLNKYK